MWFVCGWQVKLCDPLVTHDPYLSALAVVLPIIRRYTITRLLYHKYRTGKDAIVCMLNWKCKVLDNSLLTGKIFQFASFIKETVSVMN